MRAILKVCLSNFKRNRAQKLLIAITILLAALVFSLGVAVLSMIDKPFDKMYKELNASHTLLFYDVSLNNNKDVEGFWKKQKEIESTYQVPAHFLQGNAYKQDKKIDISLFVAEVPDGGSLLQDKLKVVDGEVKPNPEVGEVWLPTTFAHEQNFQVGDVINLPTRDGSRGYKVSAIIIDPQYSSPQHNPVRIWMKSGELNSLFDDATNSYVLGIRYINYNEKEEIKVWNDFEQFLGKSFTGYKLGYEEIVFKYTSVQEGVGAIMVALSFIVIIVCFILISFAISNSILSEYAVIGIFKAQGFSSGNIILTYVFQYFLIGLITVPIGSVLSIPVVQMLADQFMKALGITQTTESSLESGILTFVVLLILIVSISWLASLKTTKIKPSQAIRYGAPATKNSKRTGIPLSAIKKLPISIMMAIKDTFSQMRQMVFFVTILSITTIILVFASISISSMDNAFDDPNYMGMDDSDLTIANSNRQGVTNESIYQKLSSEKNITDVIPMNYLVNSSIFIDEDGSAKNIVGIAYDGDMDRIGINNSEGTNPKKETEISISYKLALKLHKSIGDTVEANIEGENKKFTVSGIFSTMSSDGYMFRIQNSNINTSKIGMQRVYQVKLKEGTEIDAYVKELTKEFNGAVEITDNSKFRDKFLSSIKSVIQLATLIISLVVVSVCFITVFNSILINILNMKKVYGIYKSFGMSSTDIRKSMLYRIQLITIFGSLLGILIAVYLTPLIIEPALSQGGAVKIEIIINWSQIFMIVPLCMVITALSTWVPSGRILDINPRNLIIE